MGAGLGVSTAEERIAGVQNGIDMFDCTLSNSNARI